MSDQTLTLPPEAQKMLLDALDEVRAEVVSGKLLNLVLIRDNAEGQPLPTIVGDAQKLHFALTLAAGIIVQGGLQALQLKFHETAKARPRTYFMSNESGQA